MSDNYAVINGKRVELTNEQVKALRIETRDNPFAKESTSYVFTIAEPDGTDTVLNNSDLYNAALSFNDNDFAKQVALHQLLNRKLLKFAYDNGFEDTTEWDCHNRHYHIIYRFDSKDFDFDDNDVFKRQGTVYFFSEEGALQAISEVVIPFMKEHPEFVW